LLLALGVAYVLLTNRASAGSEVFEATAAVGNLQASLRMAVLPFLRTVVGLWPETPWSAPLWVGAAMKLIFVAVVWALLPAPASTAARLSSAVVAIALLGTCFLTIVMALRQFGLVCCQRHDTFRQGLVVFALLSTAASLPRRGCSAPVVRTVASFALGAMLCGLLWLRLPAIRADLALLGPATQIRADTWASGKAPGDMMRFRPEPIGQVVAGWDLAPGTYRRADRGTELPPGMNWHVFSILLFFDKLELRRP
jgi:hypothetical protein